jgi:hypothetical protein
MRSVLAGASVVLLGLFAACGGDDQRPAESSGLDTIRKAALLGAALEGTAEDAARAYAGSFIAGDADTAYGMLSRRCRDTIGRDAFEVAVAAVALEFSTARLEEVTVTVTDDDAARVTSSFDQPALDQVGEPWLLEDGAWRNDDC